LKEELLFFFSPLSVDVSAAADVHNSYRL